MDTDDSKGYREGRGPSSMDTDESQDYRGSDRATFNGHRRVTGLQGKGEDHLPRTQTSHRTTGEGRGPSSTDTDDS